MTTVKYYDNREYFLLNVWWDNSWIYAAYCVQCGCGFPVNNNNNNNEDPKDNDITFNVYKVKNDLYCACYKNIQRAHSMRDIKWEGKLYWESLQSSPELQ